MPSSDDVPISEFEGSEKHDKKPIIICQSNQRANFCVRRIETPSADNKAEKPFSIATIGSVKTGPLDFPVTSEMESQVSALDSAHRPKNQSSLDLQERDLEASALTAILSGEKYEGADSLTIPLTFTDDMDSEQSSIVDYSRIPVEQFGAAMLRGMGWSKETDETRGKSRSTTIRPAHLGLGAQPMEFFDDGNTRANKHAGNRQARRYVPTLRRSRIVDVGDNARTLFKLQKGDQIS